MKGHLTFAEQYLWTFLEDNRAKIPLLSITEIADLANVSTATVTRTVQKAGYTGFQEYRSALQAQSLDKLGFSKEANRLIQKNVEETQRTINLLNVNDIEEAILLIKQAHFLTIFAVGPSAYVANSLVGKLRFIGKKAITYFDQGDMAYYAHQMNEKDLLIVISQRGETSSIVNAVKISQKHQAKVIVITCNYDSTLSNLGDCSLFAYNSPLKVFASGNDITSRLSLEMITRILVDMYVLYNEEGTIRNEVL